MKPSELIRRPAEPAPAANDPTGGAVTMTSVELVEYINSYRRQQAREDGVDFPSKGYAELRHRDFSAKVPEVLGAGVCEKFRAPWVNPQNQQTYSIFVFPKREACLMAMSYSYDLQAVVFDRMTELEAGASLAKFNIPTTLSEALRFAADKQERIEHLELEVQAAAPKVQFFDRVVERDTLMNATQVGQKLKLSAINLNKALDALDVYHGGIKRGRAFKQWFVDKGYGLMKQTEAGYPQPLFTAAGGAWAVEKLIAEGY